MTNDEIRMTKGKEIVLEARKGATGVGGLEWAF
jgi:hypothetical protein